MHIYTQDELLAIINAIEIEMEVQGATGLCWRIAQALKVGFHHHNNPNGKFAQINKWKEEWEHYSGDKNYPVPYNHEMAEEDHYSLELLAEDYMGYTETWHHMFDDTGLERFELLRTEYDDYEPEIVSYAEVAYESDLDKWEGEYGKMRKLYAEYLIGKCKEQLNERFL